MRAKRSKASLNGWVLSNPQRQAALEQQAFERREAERKDWFNGYSNRQEGETYNGIAI